MRKFDRLKIELDFLKNAVSANIVAILGIISYWFINYKKLDMIDNSLILTGFSCSLFSLVILLKKVKNKLDELENSNE